MKNYSIRKYTTKDFDLWNEFIAKSKNGTFLFDRNFMEYHKDRLEDFSLLVFDEKKLVAVFPANRVGEGLYSHQGLTYGGIILDKTTKLSDFVELFDAFCDYLKPNFRKVFFKEIPKIYNQYFSDELLYALFLKNAKLIRRDTLSVIDYQCDYQISAKRKYEIRKSQKYPLEIKQSTDFSEFWNELLLVNLNEKHNTKPVHSLEEITLLQNRFPENIKQFNVYLEQKIVAGATIFETENVAHVQYIASISDNQLKNKIRASDYLFDYLIKKYATEKKYFDFGISNENQGKTLNKGLLYWKESFGARTVTQDFYELSLI